MRKTPKMCRALKCTTEITKERLFCQQHWEIMKFSLQEQIFDVVAQETDKKILLKAVQEGIDDIYATERKNIKNS